MFDLNLRELAQAMKCLSRFHLVQKFDFKNLDFVIICFLVTEIIHVNFIFDVYMRDPIRVFLLKSGLSDTKLNTVYFFLYRKFVCEYNYKI